MAILTSCDAMVDTSNSFVNQITSIASQVDSTYNSFESSMKEYVNTFLSPDGVDLNGIYDQAIGVAADGVSDIFDTVHGYTGDCLNSILNPIQGILDDFNSFGESIIGSTSGILGGIAGTITGALGQFLGLNGLFTALGLSDYVLAADNLFGCLSSAECLPFGEIQGMMSQVTGVIKKFGLTDSGTFELKDWFNNKIDILVNLPDKIVESIKNGLQGFADKFSTFFSDLKDKFTNLMDTFKNFSSTSITGFLSNFGAIGGVISGLVKSATSTAQPSKAGLNGVWDVVKVSAVAAARKKNYQT